MKNRHNNALFIKEVFQCTKIFRMDETFSIGYNLYVIKLSGNDKKVAFEGEPNFFDSPLTTCT